MNKKCWLSILSLALVVCGTSTVLAADRYKDCTFEFAAENVGIDFFAVTSMLKIEGAVNPKETTYDDLCALKNGSKFVFLNGKNPKGQNDPFFDPESRSENFYVARVKVDGCAFEYDFGIVNGKYLTRSNYKKKCGGDNVSHGAGLKYLRLNGNDWGGACNNGQVVTVKKERDGMVCASAGVGASKCDYGWTPHDAATYACSR